MQHMRGEHERSCSLPCTHLSFLLLPYGNLSSCATQNRNSSTMSNLISRRPDVEPQDQGMIKQPPVVCSLHYLLMGLGRSWPVASHMVFGEYTGRGDLKRICRRQPCGSRLWLDWNATAVSSSIKTYMRDEIWTRASACSQGLADVFLSKKNVVLTIDPISAQTYS